MRDSHDGYPCREPELLASLHAAEEALRELREAASEDAEYVHHTRHGDDLLFEKCQHGDCVDRRRVLLRGADK